MMRMIKVCWAVVLLCLAPISAAAIEPDAPQGLMQRDDVLPTLVQRHINNLPQDLKRIDPTDRRAARAYYRSGQRKLLWVSQDGPTEHARNLMAELARAGEWGLRASDFRLPPVDQFESAWPLDKQVAFEARTTLAVLRYARHARGGRIDLSQMTKEIDRAAPLLSPWTVLAGIAESDDPGAFLRGLHPRHPQFHVLRQAYLEALSGEALSPEVGRATDVRRKDRRKTRRSRKSRRKSASARRRLSDRLLYNMEMWRWMPEQLGDTYIWANIPEFKFRVMGQGRIVHEERMIVGKRSNKTPMFSDAMETIVINPYWVVPNSIKVKELLPSLLQGGSVLRRKNLRIALGERNIRPHAIDWSKKDIRNYRVYQPPGGGNALGRVKFLFPNRHAVYMHDTPTKHLFKRSARAFSHGCLRVRNPLRFAEVLLQRDRGWDLQHIKGLVKSGPEDNRVSLNSKVPVHVTYFTAVVTAAGDIEWRKDIYGHERLVKAGLAGKQIAVEDTSSQQNLDQLRRKIIAGRPAADGDGQLFPSLFGQPEPAAEEQKPKRKRVRRRKPLREWRRNHLYGSRA